jgi:hypothetical protein
MKTLNITKGEYVIFENNPTSVISNNMEIAVWHYDEDYEKAKTVAKLIKNAGNTANKCNLLPSELLEQRDNLVEICNEIAESLISSGLKKSANMIKEKVKKTTE